MLTLQLVVTQLCHNDGPVSHTRVHSCVKEDMLREILTCILKDLFERNLFIYQVTRRERERERKVHWFTPLTATIARAGLV